MFGLRKGRSTLRAGAALVAALALLLTACGGDNGDDGTTDPGENGGGGEGVSITFLPKNLSLIHI